MTPTRQGVEVPLIGVALFAAVALVLVGCGDDSTPLGRSTAAKSAAESAARDVAPIPPLPDPAPALACTGREVVCVDAGAGAGTSDGSAEEPFTSVSEALAGAKAGTVVQVAAGVYEEELVLAEVNDLTLVGGFPATGGFSACDPVAHETVLQGSGSASVIDLSASSGVHIEGFRITGGGGGRGDDGANYSGGGIYVDQTATDVSIVGNRVDGNSVDRGDDSSYALGGGIASNGTGVKIVGNVVDANRAGRGGGIAVDGAAFIERNTITDNVGVGDHGGGLYVAGDVTVAGNRVEGNRVEHDYGWGGGILAFNDGTLARLRGNVVTDNAAPTAGSGVFIDDGADATLVGELYYGNRCTEQGGVALFVDSGGETPTVVEIVNVTIAEHDCPDTALGGNAIFAEASEATDPRPEVTVVNSILWGNDGRDVRVLRAEVVVTYTLSEKPIEGTGNLSADPLFVDLAGGDFHFGPSSPAVDAGDPATPSGDEAEPNGGRIDLGFTGNTAEATRS